jgi:hypothetical protein
MSTTTQLDRAVLETPLLLPAVPSLPPVPDPGYRWDATGLSLFAFSSIQQIFTINPSDSVNARVLSHGMAVTGQVTIQTCTAACQAAGYQLSGAEYADECCERFFLLDSACFCFAHGPK